MEMAGAMAGASGAPLAAMSAAAMRLGRSGNLTRVSPIFRGPYRREACGCRPVSLLTADNGLNPWRCRAIAPPGCPTRASAGGFRCSDDVLGSTARCGRGAERGWPRDTRHFDPRMGKEPERASRMSERGTTGTFVNCQRSFLRRRHAEGKPRPLWGVEAGSAPLREAFKFRFTIVP